MPLLFCHPASKETRRAEFMGTHSETDLRTVGWMDGWMDGLMS